MGKSSDKKEAKFAAILAKKKEKREKGLINAHREAMDRLDAKLQALRSRRTFGPDYNNCSCFLAVYGDAKACVATAKRVDAELGREVGYDVEEAELEEHRRWWMDAGFAEAKVSHARRMMTLPYSEEGRVATDLALNMDIDVEAARALMKEREDGRADAAESS